LALKINGRVFEVWIAIACPLRSIETRTFLLVSFAFKQTARNT